MKIFFFSQPYREVMINIPLDIYFLNHHGDDYA